MEHMNYPVSLQIVPMLMKNQKLWKEATVKINGMKNGISEIQIRLHIKMMYHNFFKVFIKDRDILKMKKVEQNTRGI